MNYSPGKLFMLSRPDPDAAVIAYLRDSSLPVVIYGSGDYGKATAKYLGKHGITKFMFATDSYNNISNVGGERPLSPAEVDIRYPAYNLIIAIQSKVVSQCYHFNNAVKVLNLRKIYDIEDMTQAWIDENTAKITETAAILNDDFSRDTLFAYIKARTVNDTEALANLGCPNIYFQRDLFSLPSGTCFVDCGAYNGDSIDAFVVECPDYSRILAFEPSHGNIILLKNYIKEKSLRTVEIIEKGCWDSNATLCFSDEGSEESKIQDSGGVQIEVTKIDDYCTAETAPMMIKMDIEGAELPALIGASRTIAERKPLLAICVYHKTEDIITIPQYIKTLVPEYKMHLRIRAGGAFFGGIDMVLFAVPPEFEYKER